MAENEDGSLPGRQNEDELSGEVSIRAKVDQSGLDIAGKSRALAAVDMLLGGAIGWPAAAMEGLRRRSAIRAQVREEALRIEGGKALDALREMPAIGAAAADRFVRDQVRKQENREAVWIEAEEALVALPPPTEEATGSSAKTNSKSSEEISPDWLNRFARYAEDATSDDLRKIWGRVLAGEIRSPQSFSLATMRVISELDAETAGSFEIWASKAVGNWIPKPKPLQGEILFELTRLEEAGLLQEVNGTITVTIKSPSDGKPSFFGYKYGCELTMKSGKSEIVLSVMVLSKTAREISSILPNTEIDALHKIVHHPDLKDIIEVDSTRLLEIVRRDGNSFVTRPRSFPTFDN